GLARRRDPGGPRPRARYAARLLPADPDRAGIGDRDRLSPGGRRRPHRELDGGRAGRIRPPMSPGGESFEFRVPDLFTAGTVGPPGQRVFYLQARERGVLVTLKVEKEQVDALAEYLAGLLERLAQPAAAAAGDLSLVEPVVPAWDVRSLGVGYDREHDRVVIVAQERGEDEEAEEAEEGEPETEDDA